MKRAYRRLARAHHPDVGGEVTTFHELQRAYEVLLGDGPPETAVVAPGRPSRPRAAWSTDQRGTTRGGVDLTSVDWDGPTPHGPCVLSRDVLARWLAATEVDEGPVRPVAATSRAPGSRLNRAAPKLSGDLTASLEIRPDVDDRGRTVVAARLTAGNRRARRALDAVGLDGGWVRRRGSASTTLHRAVTPDDERRVTALATADAVDALLDRAGWPLRTWQLTVPRARSDGG